MSFSGSCTGSRIVVFEAEPQAGGTLRTVEIDGFRFETGGQWVSRNKPDCLQLVRDAGLADRLLPAAPATPGGSSLRTGCICCRSLRGLSSKERAADLAETPRR